MRTWIALNEAKKEWRLCALDYKGRGIPQARQATTQPASVHALIVSSFLSNKPFVNPGCASASGTLPVSCGGTLSSGIAAGGAGAGGGGVSLCFGASPTGDLPIASDGSGTRGDPMDEISE